MCGRGLSSPSRGHGSDLSREDCLDIQAALRVGPRCAPLGTLGPSKAGLCTRGVNPISSVCTASPQRQVPRSGGLKQNLKSFVDLSGCFGQGSFVSSLSVRLCLHGSPLYCRQAEAQPRPRSSVGCSPSLSPRASWQPLQTSCREQQPRVTLTGLQAGSSDRARWGRGPQLGEHGEEGLASGWGWHRAQVSAAYVWSWARWA